MSLEFIVKNGLISKGNAYISGSATASLGFFGTASWANNTLNANFATSASFASSSFTSSYSLFLSGSHTGSTFGTASWALNAISASWAPSTPSSFAISASWASSSLTSSIAYTAISSDFSILANTASYAITASFASNAGGGSGTTLFTGSTYPITASWSNNTLTSVSATSASWASASLTASFLPVGTYQITSSWSNNSITSSISITSTFSTSASFASSSISASYVQTASWAINAITASAVGTTWDVQVNSGSYFSANDLVYGNFVSVPITSSFSSSTSLPIAQQIVFPVILSHATIKANNQLFGGTAQVSGSIYVLKTPDIDLTNYQIVTGSNNVGSIYQVCYVSSSNLLYFIGSQSKILQVSASDITKQSLLVDLSASYGLVGGPGPSICTDGVNIYGVTYTQTPNTSSFFKVRISDGVLIQSQSWLSSSAPVFNGHSVIIDPNNTASFYATNGDSTKAPYAAKISTANLANYTASQYGTFKMPFTDDCCLLNGFLYAASETSGSAYKINTSSMVGTLFSIDPSYGLFTDGTHVYNIAGASVGTNYFTYYPNGDLTQPYRFSIQAFINELWITDAGKFILTDYGSKSNIYQVGFGINGVGMGTTNPQYNLDVHGSLRADQIFGNISNAIGNYWKLNDANQVYNSYSGSDILIQTGSTLIVGPRATPSASFHISGSSNLNILQAYAYNGSSSAVFTITPAGTASFSYISASFITTIDPTLAQQVATKNYVDNISSSAAIATSSWARNAVTAGAATSASWASASYTSSYLNAGTYLITASWATTALTTVAATSASWASASYTASYLNPGTYLITASWSNNTLTAIAATSASWASSSYTASYLNVGTYLITASWASNALSSNVATSASWASSSLVSTTSVSSSWASSSLTSVSSSYHSGSVVITAGEKFTPFVNINYSTASGIFEYYPNIVAYESTGSVSGTILISSPIVRTGANMFIIRIHGYGYQNSSLIDYTIVGALSGSTSSFDNQSGSLVNYSLVDYGSDGLDKRVGITSGGLGVVAFSLGSTASVYNNYRLNVDYWAVYGPYNVFTSSWNVTTTTSSNYGMTGSFLLTSSFSPSSSFSNTASFAISSSFSNTASSAITSSFSTTASYANTASFVFGIPTIKSGIISGSVFGGSPRTSSIVFTNTFPNNSYTVVVTGENSRTWTIQQKAGSGFQINANSAVALAGLVFWQAMATGEFY